MCNSARKVWNTLKWLIWTIFWLFCVKKRNHFIRLLYMLAYSNCRHTDVYTASLSLLPLISLHPKELTEGISACPSALQLWNQPRGIFPEPPGLSKGLLLPNYHYELQSRPEIISTKTSCFVTSHILAVYIWCLWVCTVCCKSNKRANRKVASRGHHN